MALQESRSALVVDDSRAIRSMMKRNLEALGFAVAEAADGVEGLTWLDRNPPPALITSDWHMPNLDGLAFVKQLRKRRACWDVKVVMISAENDPKRIFQALNMGADAYIPKPVTPDAVVRELRDLGLVDRSQSV